MPKYDLTDYYLSEKQQYDIFINKIGRSNSGNLSFTSTTSGIVYNSTTGEQGILVAIQNALKDYLINANDWNNLILNAGCFANDTGVANAYVVTLNPIPSSYQTGMMVKFKATNANSGASTINVNALGIVNLVKDTNVTLVAGDILAGQIVIAIYDGTKFQIIPSYSQQFSDKQNQINTINASLTEITKYPASKVTHNANQSIANNTDTVLSFNTEEFDTDNMHDNVTNNNRLTCKTTGKYLLTANIAFETNVNGLRNVYFKVNGSGRYSEITSVPVGGSWHFISVTTLVSLNANDFVELVASQNSGGSLNVISATGRTPYLSVVKVG